MEIRIIDNEVPFDTHESYDVSLDNDEIETLVTHEPTMVMIWINNIQSEHQCRLRRLIVGLAVEWCPEFMDDSHQSVATLQLSVGKSCLIFQILRATGTPRRLKEFLGDPDHTFVGVGIKDNARKLWSEYGLEVENTRDLRSWAANELDNYELRSAGLKELAKEVLGKEIDKPRHVALSRWDKRVLTQEQVVYACVDAYFSFEIGRQLSAWY